jgi:hypothetical protein
MNQGIQDSIDAVMPALLASGLLTSLCTILVPPDSTTNDAGGAPDPSVPYTQLSGHVDIPCTAPPLAIGDKVQPQEKKQLAEIYAGNMLHVLLGGYFPTIRQDYRALIDGTQYDIIGTENDSQHQMTRLAVQVVTV